MLNIMEKKQTWFTITFVVSLVALLFYLGSSISGYVVASPATIAPVYGAEIAFYGIITLAILSMGVYYFKKKGK